MKTTKTIIKLLLATIFLFTAIEITAQATPTGSPSTTKSYTYTNAFSSTDNQQMYQVLRMILAKPGGTTTISGGSVTVVNTVTVAAHNVSVVAIPATAASAALQTTGNNYLNAIDNSTSDLLPIADSIAERVEAMRNANEYIINYGNLTTSNTGNILNKLKGVDTTNQELRRIKLRLDSINNYGKIKNVSFTITTPTLTNYANLVVMSNTGTNTGYPITLAGGNYVLTGGFCLNTFTNQPTFEVWFFTSTVTAVDAISSSQITNSQMLTYLGTVRFDTGSQGNGTYFRAEGRVGIQTAPASYPFNIPNTTGTIYAVAVARATMNVPTGTVFNCVFNIERRN